MGLLRTRMILLLFVLSLVLPASSMAWLPLAVNDDPTTPTILEGDPLLRMPGTQPNQLAGTLIGPDKNAEPNGCLNCHGENPVDGEGNTFVPGYYWMGSMMGQASRDPIFWAAMTVAMQDSIWALGNPNAADLCIRCHFPQGWLEGRSSDVFTGGTVSEFGLNAGRMQGSDFDGVHCDVCHSMWNPFFEDSDAGVREVGAQDPAVYWDEATNLSTMAAGQTYLQDKALTFGIGLFSGLDFFSNFRPKYPSYTENASGQYFIDTDTGYLNKRGPFADTDFADHSTLYSRYHKSKFFCSTCHDVSNPVIANFDLSGLVDQSGGADLITEQYSAHNYGHVERTFSEFMLSAYGQEGGAPTNVEYQEVNTTIPGSVEVVTHAAMCQDCHMADASPGTADGAFLRPDDSDEHPNSGAPVHDMQGGNIWITRILGSLDFGNTGTFDPVNYALITGDTSVLPPNPLDPPAPDPGNTQINVANLTLDITQGIGLLVGDYDLSGALNDAADRAEYQLQHAATIKDAAYDPATGVLTFKVQNNTGHKLTSGFPEGRRIWINVQAYDAGSALIHEVNPYDATAQTLQGLTYNYDAALLPAPTALAADQSHVDRLVYQMHPNSDLTGEEETFHFVLATGRYKDNRIPPKGFDIGGAAERQVEPAWHGATAPDYFTAMEYAGGYDEVKLVLPPGAATIDINLYYQGTSREYIAFLRDEINGTGNLTLYGPDNPIGMNNQTFAQANGLNPDADPAYLIQTDANGFFDGLRAWGDTIWDLWMHNIDEGIFAPTNGPVPGLLPFEMTVASALVAPTGVLPLAITAPIDAATLFSGDSVTIAWDGPDNAATYSLSYSTDGGVSYTPIADVADGSSYAWTVPAVGGVMANSSILVEAFDAAAQPLGTDEVAVTLQPAGVSILAPLAGATLTSGDIYTLDWSGSSQIVSYKLAVSANDGAKWIPVGTFNAPTTSYDWTVPHVENTLTNILFRVSAYDGTNGSGALLDEATSGPFTVQPVAVVVTSPNGGEALTSGETVTVSWGPASRADRYEVSYSFDAGTSWQAIATVTGATSTAWTVPAVTVTETGTVRVQAYRNATLLSEDVSDLSFSVDPAVTVTLPTGGETIASGSLYTITWSGGPAAMSYQVGYSVNNKPWVVLDTVNAPTTSLDWTIPAVGQEVSVRIGARAFDGADGSGNRLGVDLADAPITITPPLPPL